MVIDMRTLILLLFLSGCADMHDNTTLGDKAIIGTTLAAMAYGAATLGEW